jgi:HD superfamily phosphohydrolase
LVIEEKGIYSVEKFIISRRLMYWQVYFHKTGLMLEKILEKILMRAKDLFIKNKTLYLDNNLHHLFEQKLHHFNSDTIEIFSKLDDSDIIFHLKKWMNNPDFVLSYLSKMIINRENLNKIIIQKNTFSEKEIQNIKKQILQKYPVDNQTINYLLFYDNIINQAYTTDKHPIKLLQKNNEIIEFSQASDQLNIEALSHPVTKYYLSYPVL